MLRQRRRMRIVAARGREILCGRRCRTFRRCYATNSRVGGSPALTLHVGSMLEELDCEVLQARSGNEALVKIAEDQSIELLISDINMPGVDGVELAAADPRGGLAL